MREAVAWLIVIGVMVRMTVMLITAYQHGPGSHRLVVGSTGSPSLELPAPEAARTTTG